MRFVRIFGAVIIIGAIGGLGYAWTHRTKVYHDALAEEVNLQKPEIQICRERLGRFHAAIAAYRKDHNGGLPSAEALFPKYLKNTDDLMCPTAVRWGKKGVRFDQGMMTINRRNIPETYGFLWLTSGYGRSLKKQGDNAPMVSCVSHEEGVFRAAYKKRPPLGAFTGDTRMTWIPEVQAARMLIVRTGGKVDEADPATE